jgi:hypothetical protein
MKITVPVDIIEPAEITLPAAEHRFESSREVSGQVPDPGNSEPKLCSKYGDDPHDPVPLEPKDWTRTA